MNNIFDIDSSESEVYGKQEGNVHSAHDWQQVMEPIFARYQNHTLPIYVRADSAFGNPVFYEYLEHNNAKYVVRLRSNSRLEPFIEHLLTRPKGRPSDKPRRVIAQIEWHWDQLFPRVNYVITNLNCAAKKVVKFYNKRGAAEQWIKEGKNAVRGTKL